MNILSYLQRIHYNGPLTPDADTLHLLQRAHMLSVPFENLDIHLGRPIQLNLDALYEKIIKNRRGGFCYELNSLFAALLVELGFEVKLLAAQVVNDQGQPGLEFAHLTLLVRLDEYWLADVGFGDSSLAPLRLNTSEEQHDDRRAYRISANGDTLTLSRLRSSGTWEARQVFTLTPRALTDFIPMCHYQQTSPDSHFTQRPFCTMATPQGRVTLTGRSLAVTENGSRETREMEDEKAVNAVLKQYFGIRV